VIKQLEIVEIGLASEWLPPLLNLIE